MLGQLQMEVENFVLKMAAEFPHRKEQLIFLINNYDMMLGVITVSSNNYDITIFFKKMITLSGMQSLRIVLSEISRIIDHSQVPCLSDLC